MGTLWYVAPLAVAAVGFILFLAGVTHGFRGRFARASIGLGGGGAMTAAGLAAGLLGLNLQSYARLTWEAPVAEITVRSVQPAKKIYVVEVHRLDGSDRMQYCTLQGDEWLLAGRVQTWKPWANELGLNATYTLDQITNMYFSADEANGKPITACNIKSAPPVVNHYLPDRWVKWMMAHLLVSDRRFGSANFMPLADGALYRVTITQRGFVSEPMNDAAKRASASQAF